MKKGGMKATSTRKALTVVLIIVILGAAGGVYYGFDQVRAFAVDVSHTVADSNASGKNIEELQKLKQALAERESLVAKANKIFSTDSTYQAQALTDIQKYASTFGLTITNTNFSPKDAITPPVANAHAFVITLQSPTNYKKFLQVLDAIQGNLPKMQINSISMSRASSGSANDIAIGDITIAISTK